MISHKYKCIFIHIPKCGGSSIEELIWPNDKDRTEANLWVGLVSNYCNKYQTGGLQHLQASQIKQEVGNEVFSEYFKFTIVRNPWDRAVSQFEYMKKRRDLRAYIGMSEDACFKKYLSLIQKKNHVQWENQRRFLVDDDNNLLVNCVGRFEFFESDVLKILRVPGILRAHKKLPHINKSVRSPYPYYYDSESKEIIRHIYKADIEQFNYKFETPTVELEPA